MSTDSPIDPGTSSLLELFRGELANVRFADVDRDVLEALAGEVTAQHERVESLRAELASAEEGLATARTALVDRAREALGYARLYADRHPDLAKRLATIELAPRTRRGRKPRKPRAVKSSANAEARNEQAANEQAANAQAGNERRPRRTSIEPAAPLDAVG